MENKLLSKVINDNNYYILVKNNITSIDFNTQRSTYEFIKDYVTKYGECPRFTTVIAECEDFDYYSEVHDHYNYLIKSIKNTTAKRRAYELLQKEANEKFSKLSGSDFVNWLVEESTAIKHLVETDTGLGTNFATNGAERKECYLSRKESRSYVYIPTPYKTLTDWLGGGCELGDYVLVQAYSNKGKSWIASDFGIHAWRNGFGVMHYSPELSKAQQMDRLDTLNGQFNNSLLKRGELQDEMDYLNYLDGFDERNTVPYLVKTMGDLPKGLSIETIEADLQSNNNIKMVIIDGFLLMNHKGKGSTRDNLGNTSRKLRQLFGKYGVVGVVVHQLPTSSEKNKGEDESGLQIVKAADLHEYSESIALIQDACIVLNFDQANGMGILKLAKARTPNVGNELELNCSFNNGMIKEVEVIDFI